MKARGIFYGALMAAFWFAVPFAFLWYNIIPLAIAVAAMLIATAAASIRGKSHVV